MFRVQLLNDDSTPMEFVLVVLKDVFGKSRDEAVEVMLETHRHGRGTCGVYGRAEAEAKVIEVADLARRHKHLLTAVAEPDARPLARGPLQTPQVEVESPQATLFDPARHLPIRADEHWNPDAVRSAIQEIVDEALACSDPERYWPAHPLDEGVRDGETSLYFGAAGVIWALDHLRRTGAAKVERDFAPLLPQLLAANRLQFGRGPYPGHASWLMGEVAVLALAMRLAPETATADALYGRCAANLDRPVLELMWGMPGTMIACHFAHQMTQGEARWRELFVRQAARLLAELEETPDGPLWTQHLYGQRMRYLGPVHGFAGNMLPLLKCWDWLDSAQRARAVEAVPRTLAANAWQTDDGAANWHAIAPRASPPRLVQHCHGAPGMVTTFADGPIRMPELDALLIGGGELIWQAGPLSKGSGLCHGTAGNGYAFLKLWCHTRDTLWLERARAFAMPAIGQCHAARERHGRGRFSLWTGDLGLAIYLADCLKGRARFPTADVF
jgi:ATP-dependent Clp protease adapter protein ClpS